VGGAAAVQLVGDHRLIAHCKVRRRASRCSADSSIHGTLLTICRLDLLLEVRLSLGAEPDQC